jgi:hypothetical protein
MSLSKGWFIEPNQGGKEARILASSTLQLRPSASRLPLYVALGFAAVSGYNVEDFRCKIPASYSQT